MTRTQIGLNIRLRYVQDIGALRRRLTALEPAWCVLCVDKDEHIAFVKEFALEFPQVQFVGRMVDVNPDGGEPRDGKWHTKPLDARNYVCSPEDFLNAWGDLGRDGLLLNVSNEPNGYADGDNLTRLAAWTLEVLELATARGIACCVLNFATGHPLVVRGSSGIEWANTFDAVLRYVSANRQHAIGLHEYLPGVGINDRVGRLGALVNRCNTLGITPPRVIITEYGTDYNGLPGIDGYKSRGWGGDLYATVLSDTVTQVYQAYIEGGVLEGAAVFVYAGGERWKGFDVEADPVFFDTLTTVAPRVEVLPSPLTPLPVVEGILTTPVDAPVSVTTPDTQTTLDAPVSVTTPDTQTTLDAPVSVTTVETVNPAVDPTVATADKITLTIELTGDEARLLLKLIAALKNADLVVKATAA